MTATNFPDSLLRRWETYRWDDANLSSEFGTTDVGDILRVIARWVRQDRAAGVSVAPQPDSPAADDGVACNWDENGYCRCKPAPALDVERLAYALNRAFGVQPVGGPLNTIGANPMAAARLLAREYAALATGDEP